MKLNDIKEKDIEEIADSTGVLERGIDYFHSGRVKRVWFEGETISANIIGSGYRDYTTKVWCAKDGLEWKCTCPYDGWCCKHVVAVLYHFIKNKRDLMNDLKEEDKKMTAIGKELQNLDNSSLTNIILELINKNRNIKVDLLEMLEKNYKFNDSEQICIQRYNEYWNTIDPILDDFNEYGGGPTEDEDTVYENLEKIVSLFHQNKLPQDVKVEFIDNLFYYYNMGNSGFEDPEMDAIFEVASNELDWKYIIEKLQEEDTEWRRSLIMEIYKDHLNDDGNYLKLREAELKYGMHYFELSQFWQQNGDIDKAVEIAKNGLKNGEGRIIDLIEFLFKFYNEKNDYKNALTYAEQKFDDSPSYSRYNELKNFCKKKDWHKIETECLDKLKKVNRKSDLAKIYLDKKEYDKVLEYVFDTSYFGLFDDRSEFADKLKEHYPEEILKFYKERVQQSINVKTRRSYKEAAKYADKVKHIYADILERANNWKNYITSIRNKYPNHPALQDEFSRL